MKYFWIVVALVVGIVCFTSCGQTAAPESETKTETQTETGTTTTTTSPKGDFEKFAQVDWIKIGVLKGWAETVDESQKTIKLSDGKSTTVEISYTISDTPENYEKTQAGAASGKVTTDKVKYGNIEYIRDSIEYAGSVSGVNLYAPYESDGTAIIYINGPIIPDIEKMLGSIEIK